MEQTVITWKIINIFGNKGIIHLRQAKQSRTITSDSQLSKMSEFIYLRGGGPVTVEDLAEHLNYSPGYLRVLVRQHANLTTKEFIDRERIKIIKEMLRYSDIRIKELAHIMQFHDVKYFTRFFRKYTGETPRSYLRNCQNKSAEQTR